MRSDDSFWSQPSVIALIAAIALNAVALVLQILQWLR